MHYAAVTAVTNPASGQRQWLTVFDNVSSTYPSAFNTHTDLYNAVGWALSGDITGTSWTPYEPDAGWEESNWTPGPPSDGQPFMGWRGDPTVTVIGDPPNGQTAMIVSMVASTASISDVAYLMSTNGGASWGSPTYLTQQADGGAFVGAGDIDQPQVTSNAHSPYSTFAAWSSDITNPPTLNGWITSINNITYAPSSSSSAPSTWNTSTTTGSANSPKKLPFSNVVRPKLAISSVACGGTTHEIVWVAWTDLDQGRVCNVSGPTATANWYLTIFDNTTNAWYGSQIWVDTDTTWPNCVGNGMSNVVNSDEATPAIVAVNTMAAIAHNRSTPLGSRIRIDQYRLTCSDAGVLVVTNTRSDLSPDPCYYAGSSQWCYGADGGAHIGNGPDGGNVNNDQWGPALALKGPRLMATWYDTSGDVSNSNVRVNATVNALGQNPFLSGSSPLIFTVTATSDAGQQVPWPQYTGVWWDYQGIGFDSVSGTFLAAWGGDGRLVNDAASGPSGVWAARVQP